MTKAEIIEQVSFDTKTDKTTATAVVESFIANIKKANSKGVPVFIRGFGSYTPKQRKGKTARNIGQGTELKVPARIVPVFKPAPEFKKQVIEGTTHLITQ